MTEETVKTIVIPGGSGFLGRLLARHFAAQNFRVVILSRSLRPIPHATVLTWDARTLGPWTAELENAAAVVNLTGRSVNCRYTRRNRRAMMDSRILSTRVLGQAIAACKNPPPVWLNASTATIYKHSFDRPMDDLTGIIGATPEAKDAFSIEIARAWETEFDAAPTPHTRKVTLRAAMVLALEPRTVLCIMTRLAHLRLAGPMAGGRQYISWIHQQDFCRAVGHLLAAPLTGPVNLAAPHPLTNADFLRVLRRHLRIRLAIPAPRFLLELGAFFIRTETELMIKSRRVIPTRLLNSGFRFLFPTLESALPDLFSPRSPSAGCQGCAGCHPLAGGRESAASFALPLKP